MIEIAAFPFGFSLHELNAVDELCLGGSNLPE